MSIAGSHMNCCRDYKPSSRQSLGSARRGRDGNPASSTARVQYRKAPTYVPARDKLRSQPGPEDHQAHRNSKGSNHRKRGRQGQRHRSLRRWYEDRTVVTRSQRKWQESWKSSEEDSKSNQVHATQVSKEQPLMGGTRKGHAGVSETDQKIAMNTGGMSHSKHKTPTRAPRHPAKRRRLTRSGVRR